ncbi:periplasmic nitrate reductase electron transfer subunit [Endozoicomonas sp. OPT23]|uniref:nitrate reductase cytochrome c-type subunit n=1 Tax=Endozoicomonas sp. OPT23 TaxID=2072845 RepID=UPI00129B672E|nr:nitrate reductase cytochrome c-type subunit [Endozoicomonas sp. OPT23]MRI32409.1 periplasmic nitrate reductase electron transfer subunit [Endozoicomonas sp. OPT23]
MKKLITFLVPLLFTCLVSASETGGLNSLRTDDLSIQAPAEAMKKVHESDSLLKRDFIQQPPMIPHDIRGYDINKNVNSCLRCHSWKNASKWGATRISVTHFYDRDGKQLADVAPGRYFCVQCHVPQADAKPLLENMFEPVDSLKKQQ